MFLFWGILYSGITKPRSWKNSEFDQDALRLVLISKNDCVRVNLRENSEVFISEFSVFSTVQNRKLGAGKLRSLIKVPLRENHSEFLTQP